MDRNQGTAIWILVGCLGLFFVVVCGGAGAYLLFLRPFQAPVVEPAPGLGPVPDPTGPMLPPGSEAPRRVVARVSSVTGGSPVPVGTTCDFAVSRVERGDGTFWCNAQVTCGGQLLYGGPNAGFFECTLYDQPQRHVVGGEDQTTSVDSDAAMQLDTLRGILSVRDDAAGRFGAYSLTADVLSVQ